MSVTLGVVPKILTIETPTFPGLRFEYHEHQGKVYLIEPPASPGGLGRGVCIAEHVDTHGRAYGFVQTYLRGYRRGLEGKAEHG